jgi:hypothetical protein
MTMYSELMLRKLWSDIVRGKRTNLTICIDEAHRLTKSTHSIVDVMSREIRYRGRLWIITQNLFDIRATGRANFGTKLAFKAGDEDLKLVRGINEIFHYTLGQLQKYEFIDLEFPRFHEYLPIFQYSPSQSEPHQLSEPTVTQATPEEGLADEGKDVGSAEGEENHNLLRSQMKNS